MNYVNQDKSKIAPTNCIAIDIDGTLIIDGVLNARLLNWIEDKKRLKWDCILWSARGRKYAESVARKNKIDHLFTAIIGKPHYFVDDSGLSWIKHTRIITGL
jgi:hypothetical protein